MKIITVINDKNHAGFALLRLSCVLNGLELLVLVSGRKEFASNRIKDELLKGFLSRNLPDDEIILFTDGNDAIMMANEEEILKKYHRVGKELVFSTETVCWPDPELASQYPVMESGPYRFLNSGGFLGRAGTIREFLEDDVSGESGFSGSNQYLWTKRYFNHPDRIGLDTRCQIFHTFSPELGSAYLTEDSEAVQWAYYLFMKEWFRSGFIIRKSRIFSKVANSWPCQAHFNGFSKMLMDEEIVDMVLAMAPESFPTTFVFDAYSG